MPAGDSNARRQETRAQQLRQGHAQIRPHTSVLLKAAVAVLLCVALILSVVYCTLRTSNLVLWVWAAAEVVFCVHYWCLCVPYFTALAHKQSPEDHDTALIKQKLLEQLFRVDDIMAAMESWFLEAGPGDVRRDNLKELFAYAIWYKSLEEMEAEGLMSDLEDLMKQLEKKYGQRVPNGYNPDLKFMSHLWEPLRHIYRPLFFYVVMELLALICHVALLATGFSMREIDGISYYTFRVGRPKLVAAISTPLKRSRSSAAVPASAAGSGDAAGGSGDNLSAVPIVFLHGVGAGLLPYLFLIFRLAALGRPMILPHSKHVSMRLVSWIPTVDDMADATAAMLAAHGFTRTSVLAHSYGTMVASRLVMKYPQLVHSMCLTDPVCFAMFMPNLLCNFIYKRHSSGCWPLDFILRLVASELHCCANFSRKFFWSAINLWDEHIPERTLVVLGGQDILSPTAQVDRWLREHTHAQVMFEPSMRHAGMLLSMDWQCTILSTFAEIMQQPSSTVRSPVADATAKVTAVGSKADAVKQARSDTAVAAAPAALPSRKQHSGGTAPVPAATVDVVAHCSAGQHTTCSHHHSRLCSDCLISCQLPEGLCQAADTRKPSTIQRASAKQQQQQSSGQLLLLPQPGQGSAAGILEALDDDPSPTETLQALSADRQQSCQS